jgi:uncharacterized protein YdhG (YjbR/CyaY superfamily)
MKKPADAGSKAVDEYIGKVPEPARATLKKLRQIILSAVPPETVELISYRIPSYKYKGYLIGFAAFAKHCSLFPGAITEAFKDDLKNFEISRGTIRFPPDKPPSAALLKKIIKARIAQNESK